MVKTFDEAIKYVKENSFVEEMLSDVVDLEEMIELLEKLKQKYAPTIEMTQFQYNDLRHYRVHYPLDKFIYDFCEIYDTELSEKDLAQAWLHPETIKIKG